MNSHLLKGVVTMAELTKVDNRQPMGKIKPTDKMVMMPSLFDGTKPATSKQHYERFNLYINFQTKSGHLTDPVREAIDLFEHTLDKTALVWFQTNRSKFKDLTTLKTMFLQRYNPWGKTKREQLQSWNILSFNPKTTDVDEHINLINTMEERQMAKHPQALSGRQDPRSINPFPLKDSEGRHEAVKHLYHHAGEHALACHDVAAQGMATHHLDLEAGMTKSLNNMVLCMISGYHLTCLSQGLSYISLVLPEAARNLLPPLEEYRAGNDFQGTWDARVLERAKTLRVAVWLHHLDMAAAEDREASYSLYTSEHSRGPLLEFLLAPWASNLTFEEVVHQVLGKNRDKMESSLNHVQGLQAQL